MKPPSPTQVDQTPIDQQLKDLLSTKIQSIEQLEIVLFLRLRRGEAWTPSAIGREVNLSPGDVRAALHHLRLACLVDLAQNDRTSAVRYFPGAQKLSDTVDRLAALYERHPVEVIKIMSAQALARVRMGTLHFFGDAFVLGRKRDG